jgi:hypothetical protein
VVVVVVIVVVAAVVVVKHLSSVVHGRRKNEYLTSRLYGKINTETVNSERLELMKRLCYYRLRACTLGSNKSSIQRRSFPWRQSDQSSTLTIHLHLVS